MDSLELGAVTAGGLGLVPVGIGLIGMTMALHHLFVLGTCSSWCASISRSSG